MHTAGLIVRGHIVKLTEFPSQLEVSLVNQFRLPNYSKSMLQMVLEQLQFDTVLDAPTFFTASSIKRYPLSVTPLAKFRPVISAPKPFLMTLSEEGGLCAVTVSVRVVDMMKQIQLLLVELVDRKG